METTLTLAHDNRARSRDRERLESLLTPLGVRINGDNPWDLQVLDDAFYTRALPRGNTGILDAYVDGWWECERLDELTARVLRAEWKLPWTAQLALLAPAIGARLFNRQNRRRSLEIRRHYDLGNDLYAAMLDRHWMYSCGYWQGAANLEEAQEAKLDLICRKVGLEPGMRVLDIGCGWGGFARWAAERHGVSVVGITLSQEQLSLGREHCADLAVELRLQDYRDLGDERFDAVISIGMFEHVGYKNYRRFFEIVRRCLEPGGLCLLHTIGNRISRTSTEPWIHQNIFPNSMLPSARQISTACEGQLLIEDWHNFGADYDKTLMAWWKNFEAGWEQLRPRYGDRFYRMWRCYLLTCAGSFRARRNQLWQIVLSRGGVEGGYHSIR